ncbi:Peptide chain release factor 1 [Rickettsiales endosymbiont of Paramecium tredecaurelia]|uniref:peptide chain release factor 1 n=1 Tax=Candidatus Sarmatiella mevalonica TaxID=2770581 RepID=UPI0019236C24|nr:peptide chain release factor 1 [Candidatus Sarmatiella mevalonica]MBL3285153.1 Peptide chain release factor 1 [Candidatus Sarmatiella mevalonica]
MSFIQHLEKILDRYNFLSQKLSGDSFDQDFVKLAKEYADLKDIVEKITAYNKASQNLMHAQEGLLDSSLDDEMKELFAEEINELQSAIPRLEKEIKLSLIPKDEADSKNVILEVRAGTGGEEACLFASDLFFMYRRYAENQGWKFEIFSISDTGIGGCKEATALIKGHNVYAKLKFEAGVHRVQRVPVTEANGRIHTSAATVAILPEVEDVDVTINESDLLIDTYRASGAGGQHVNTTDSAVRITHVPTGIVVAIQDERSQHKNKAKALKILRSKIYEIERERLHSERSASRKEQVGSGDRSERIRTYNFPQGRVSDHRINLTLYKIDAVLRNGQLEEFIDALVAQDEAMKLANNSEQY